MRICVMGAGVVGLTTAWWLHERGFKVTIVDRRASAGLETSFANGAQLSYEFVTPLAAPETVRKLPSLLLSRAAPIRIRPSLDPDFIRWGIDFLKQCNTVAVARTTAAQLALAALSRAELSRLSETQRFDFGLATAGKLILYRSAKGFDAARRQLDLQHDLGMEQSVLSPSDCLDLEPALRIAHGELAGGTYSASEQLGDCAAFCSGLEARLRRSNTVEWRMGTAVRSPVIRNGALTAIETSGGVIEADLFVLSMASGSVAFARAAGLRLPIYPMKGYSITAAARAGAPRLRRSVTDADRKIVFAPLEREGETMIRAAGIADLVGHDTAIDEKRLHTVIRLTADTLDIDATRDLQPWAGLRPATPDSRPIIGPSPIDGLFLNTGHGGLGWTLACGSARLAADLIARETPPLDAALFALKR